MCFEKIETPSACGDLAYLPCIPCIEINKGLGKGFPVSLVHCLCIARVLLSLIIRVSYYCSLLPRIVACAACVTGWLTKCATSSVITAALFVCHVLSL